MKNLVEEEYCSKCVNIVSDGEVKDTADESVPVDKESGSDAVAMDREGKGSSV